MHGAGVEILAGMDHPFPFCFPGFSVHDELALLVEAGLTPMEALQTATRNPARYLDRPADLGTVEKGKLADLVLLVPLGRILPNGEGSRKWPVPGSGPSQREIFAETTSPLRGS
jgi:hypothetical protein